MRPRWNGLCAGAIDGFLQRVWCWGAFHDFVFLIELSSSIPGRLASSVMFSHYLKKYRRPSNGPNHIRLAVSSFLLTICWWWAQKVHIVNFRVRLGALLSFTCSWIKILQRYLSNPWLGGYEIREKWSHVHFLWRPIQKIPRNEAYCYDSKKLFRRTEIILVN